jgi:hypothetical protein
MLPSLGCKHLVQDQYALLSNIAASDIHVKDHHKNCLQTYYAMDKFECDCDLMHDDFTATVTSSHNTVLRGLMAITLSLSYTTALFKTYQQLPRWF